MTTHEEQRQLTLHKKTASYDDILRTNAIDVAA